MHYTEFGIEASLLCASETQGVWMMKKSVLGRACIGFVLGMMAFLLICIIFYRKGGRVYFYSDALVLQTGNAPVAIFIQLLVCGLYGAMCMSGTVFYEVERWSLIRATVLHYLIVSLGYLFPALLLGWKVTPGAIILIESMITIGFFLIWLIMFLRYKKTVKELNALMREKGLEEKRK